MEKEERKQEEEKERAETKRTEGAKGFVVVLVLFLDKQSLHKTWLRHPYEKVLLEKLFYFQEISSY